MLQKLCLKELFKKRQRNRQFDWKEDKITLVGKPKNKGREGNNEPNEMQEIYITPEKCQQHIDILRLF